MPATFTLQKNSPVNNPDKILVSVALSGSYTTGGDPVDFTPSKYLNPNGIDQIGPNLNPQEVAVGEEALGGYYCQVVKGTALATGWKLAFYASQGSELAASAYPAGITGGTLDLWITLQDADR